MIYPSSVKKFDSVGEKIMYNKFKRDTSFNNLIILHSQFLAKHFSSISGEIDFLLLYPNHGFFVLELKHGRVERKKGVWQYYNRKEQGHTSEKGPFRQANDAMHSIRNWVLDNCHSHYRAQLNKVLFGTGVIFSGFDEMIDLGTEGFQWQVLYRELIVKNKIIGYFDNLSSNWHNERSTQNWYDQYQSKPSKELCVYVSKLLRGDFSRDYSLLNKIRDNNTIIKEFTSSQLDKYSHILYNDRNLLTGPAGTGKTVLAYQLAIEIINSDKNVLFLCFNLTLGEKLKAEFSKIEKSNNSFFGHYHSFLMSNCSVEYEDSSEFFREKLPLNFLFQNEEFERYDYLIIDECQDLINDTNLMVFDHILKKGLDKGKWSFFGDFEKQSMYENDSNIELLSIFSFTKYEPLNINCRNSIRVSNQNEIMTGVTYSRCLNIDNDENVTLKFPIMSSNIKEFDSIISKLIIDGVDLDRITTLYPEKSFWSHLISESSHKNILAEGSIGHSTIHSFKGLENDIIIVIGFKELLSRKARQLLYIAISRATFKLYLIFDSKLEAEFTHLISKE